MRSSIKALIVIFIIFVFAISPYMMGTTYTELYTEFLKGIANK